MRKVWRKYKWTPEAVDLLRDLYGMYKPSTVALKINNVLGTDFTGHAVRQQASIEEIDSRDAQGYLCIKAAADELGIDFHTLWKHLARSKVKLLGRAKHRFLPDEVWKECKRRWTKPPEPTVTSKEAATRLCYTVQGLNKLYWKGKIRGYMFGGRLLISVADIQRILDERRQAARKGAA